MMPEIVERVRTLRRAGRSCRDVARAIGVGKSTVQRIAPGYRLRCPDCGARVRRLPCLSCALDEDIKKHQETSKDIGGRRDAT